MTGAKRGFLTLLRDRSGNVLPIAAVGMLLSAALVGGGIDMSRAYRAQNRLQAACDSGALAGRRAVLSSGFDQPAKDQASAFFNTNFNDNAMETENTVFTPTSTDNGQTINASASTTLKLAVMKIFGFQAFDLAVTCTASMGVGNSDVVMVLDTTGSMTTDTGGGVTRLAALQQAMKNFYTTVQTATTGTNARIRYGFVPYSTTVNVGKLLYAANPAYLKDTRTNMPTRKAVTSGSATTTDNNIVNGSSQNDTSVSYSSSSNCNAALTSTTWTNNGASSTLPITIIDGPPSSPPDYGKRSWTVTTRQPQTHRVYTSCYKSGSVYYRSYYNQTKDLDSAQKWVLQYYTLAAGYDVSAYKTFATVTTNTGDYGDSVSSTWEGCIEERGTSASSSFSYSTLTGITPAAAIDLNIDSAPTDDNSKWAPMWPEVAYFRRTSGGSYSTSTTTSYGTQSSSCPYDAQLLAEMSQDEFNTYAGKLKAEGSTYLDIGMVWGGRLSSPDGIFGTNVKVAPTNGGEVSRHIIFMTDGIMDPSPTTQSAWGLEWHDRRVTSDGSDSQDTSRHTSRFLAICEEIKAKGIRVWAISFTSGTNSTLSTCASANSYYNADNPTQLNAAFQEIAKQVGELRLTQ